jgi:Zn-dependent protease with chaperone function/TPR repeat protein
MSVLQARYFDGRNSIEHEVGVLIGGGRLKLVGRDISAEFEARKVRVAPRLANTPRWIYLPGGGACVFSNNDVVDAFARERRFPRFLHRLESLPAVAAVAVVLVVLSLWLLIDRGLPPAVKYIAERIPRGAETTLGEETLAALDDQWLHPSKLGPPRQQALRGKFADLARAAGDTGTLRLEFRSAPVIGANAFALPSGIIVVTDELVGLARNDEQVLAVLAHEIGHVRYRHTMRRLLESSATALIIAGVTGDIASTTSLAASAPALLLQTKYSRDYEREADRFAIDLLQQAGISPQNFAAILERLERKHGRRPGLPGFLSSHPPTAEREALARASAGASSDDESADDGRSDERLANLRPERPPVAIVDPEQRQIAELLEKRDYAGLEGILGGRQLAFENNPKTSRQLEQAFEIFAKIPRHSEVALSEWVKTAPSSYSARVARGGFYLSRGIEERGEDLFSDTSKGHIDAMEAYFDQSLDDLERSLRLSQRPYLSRRYMMAIMLRTGSREELKANYLEALRLAPGSVETRLAYMRSLEPRWGGSYQQMEAFVAESRPALAPGEASRLAARIPAYRAFESIRSKDYPGAHVQLAVAVALDPNADVLCQRAYVRGQIKLGNAGFRDAADALAKARDNRYCMRMATWLAGNADDPDEVSRVMGMVIEVDSSNALAYSQRGWSYERQHKRDLAFPDYLAAAKLGNAWAQGRVGQFYLDGVGVRQDREEGLAWLRKAAEQGDPEALASLKTRQAPGRPPP